MATANLLLRFVVELVGVGVLAYWGSQASTLPVGRVALAIGAPLALIITWAIVVAPNARNVLTQPQRDAIGTVLLVGSALALAAAGQRTAAVVFGAIVVMNWVALLFFGQDPADALRATVGRGN